MKKVNLSKEVKKAIENNKFYSEEMFLSDAKTYVSAIKNNRMICIINSVSASGMSRTMKFISFEKKYYRQYISFFECMGYKFKNRSDYFSVSGCGMDMVFNTNYNIMHNLKNMGIISKKECEILAQKTPGTH